MPHQLRRPHDTLPDERSVRHISWTVKSRATSLHSLFRQVAASSTDAATADSRRLTYTATWKMLVLPVRDRQNSSIGQAVWLRRAELSRSHWRSHYETYDSHRRDALGSACHRRRRANTANVRDGSNEPTSESEVTVTGCLRTVDGARDTGCGGTEPTAAGASRVALRTDRCDDAARSESRCVLQLQGGNQDDLRKVRQQQGRGSCHPLDVIDLDPCSAFDRRDDRRHRDGGRDRCRSDCNAGDRHEFVDANPACELGAPARQQLHALTAPAGPEHSSRRVSSSFSLARLLG